MLADPRRRLGEGGAGRLRVPLAVEDPRVQARRGEEGRTAGGHQLGQKEGEKVGAGASGPPSHDRGVEVCPERLSVGKKAGHICIDLKCCREGLAAVEELSF